MKALSVSQMKSVEKNAVALGVSYIELMENAGVGSARKISQRCYVINKGIVILCGNGNNGGDGFVIARKLYEKGANVTVVLCQGKPRTQESTHMYSLLEHVSVDILNLETDLSLALFKIKQADLIIDTIFGTGFYGEIQGLTHQVVERANASSGQRVAIDIPSGINGDSGRVEGVYFQAELTLALGAYKKAHLIEESQAKCGELELIDIGIPAEAFDGMDLEVVEITSRMVKNLFPKRDPNANKGTYGKLLNISGSVGMGGAALMSTKAALRSGAGLVTLAAPRSVVQGCFAHLMEATTIPLAESSAGTIGDKNEAFLEEKLKSMSAAILGCGLGSDEGVRNTVKELIKFNKIPMVLDADGINAVSDDITIVKEARCSLVLTPHPGEMARLTGLTIEQIQNNRVKTAYDFARDNGVVLVLKGHSTIIATPEGTVFRNPTGNAGMARGGSGDVLSGMIGAFLAQGLKAEEAAIAGVYLHGLAGDICAEKYTQYAMIASDLIECIPAAFRECVVGKV